jgi:hypothetical protein
MFSFMARTNRDVPPMGDNATLVPPAAAAIAFAADGPRQLRRLRAERDQLRQELFSLEALYCAMVDSRSVLFFEKEV